MRTKATREGKGLTRPRVDGGCGFGGEEASDGAPESGERIGGWREERETAKERERDGWKTTPQAQNDLPIFQKGHHRARVGVCFCAEISRPFSFFLEEKVLCVRFELCPFPTKAQKAGQQKAWSVWLYLRLANNGQSQSRLDCLT